ncbi:MAG: hypothetical protein HYV40_00295 [Candidatus Levybacteria bacterium]|nr:hypothetical protein [Candidatus Levybacteria bacterium]
MQQDINAKIAKLTTLPKTKKVLSIYLGEAEKHTPHPRLLLTRLHSLVHSSLSAEERKYFARAIATFDAFLREEYDTHSRRTVVLFTDSEKLFEILSFEFYLPSLCVVSYSPYLTPISKAVSLYRPYLVVLVDRKKAVIFVIHLGEVEEKIVVSDGNVPQNVRANERDFYGRPNKIYRHIEDHLHRHLHVIVAALDEAVRRYETEFILIGGQEETINKLRRQLPHTIESMVLETFRMDPDTPLDAIVQTSKKVAEGIVAV